MQNSPLILRRARIEDAGALEAALFRPQTGYYDDIIAEAAALFESLAINHPFIDGNKRIAFAAMDVYLRVNGYRLERGAMAVYSDLMRMFEEGTIDFRHLDAWLRGIVRKID